MQTEQHLEDYFTSALNCQIAICICADEARKSDLTPNELAVLSQITHERRRSSWLKGRLALKELMIRTSRSAEFVNAHPAGHAAPAAPDSPCSSEVLCDTRWLPAGVSDELSTIDTTMIRMPSPSYSLTHSDHIAIAISSTNTKYGIGIDIEGGRPIREATSKFFLTDSEKQSLLNLDYNTLLRLWTAKESLFKSDLQNKDMTILKYETHDPTAHTGTAIRIDNNREFKYASIQLDDQYWLTVSIPIGAPKQ